MLLVPENYKVESATTRNLRLLSEAMGLPWNLSRTCNKVGTLRFLFKTIVTCPSSTITLPLLSINLSNKEAAAWWENPGKLAAKRRYILWAKIDIVRSKSTLMTMEEHTRLRWKKCTCSEISVSTNHRRAYLWIISLMDSSKSLVIIRADWILRLPVIAIWRIFLP